MQGLWLGFILAGVCVAVGFVGLGAIFTDWRTYVIGLLGLLPATAVSVCMPMLLWSAQLG